MDQWNRFRARTVVEMLMYLNSRKASSKTIVECDSWFVVLSVRACQVPQYIARMMFSFTRMINIKSHILTSDQLCSSRFLLHMLHDIESKHRDADMHACFV